MKQPFRHIIINYYCTVFYALFVFKWCNNMLLYQQQPVFIYNTFDAFSWLFMQTGIHKWLLQTKHFLLFDVLFYTAPLSLLIASFTKQKWVSPAAVYVLVINWIYLQCYFLFPISSYTIFVVWLLFPLVFIPKNEATCLLLFDGIRYFFLYFFASAGIWKLINKSAFNPVQLSGILLEQHKEMLTNSPDYWLTILYRFLIFHTSVSSFLYIVVMLMEFSFIIGFFTKKFDSFLIIIYFIFLLADYFIMRIPYFETLPFLLTLYFRPPLNSTQKWQ